VITKEQYDFFNDNDEYELLNLLEAVEKDLDVTVVNKTTNKKIQVQLTLSSREKGMIQYGGLLNAIKETGGKF